MTASLELDRHGIRILGGVWLIASGARQLNCPPQNKQVQMDMTETKNLVNRPQVAEELL